MMTVHEVSKISGVSIRALHHYDHILDSPDFDRSKALEQQYLPVKQLKRWLQKKACKLLMSEGMGS